MQTAKQIIKFPVKGLHLGLGYESQPKGTTSVARNVMPFDPRAGRLRGGQRAGTINTASVGTGAAVRRLHTVAVVTSGEAADNAVLTETFTYADGNLATVSGAAWVCKANQMDGSCTLGAPVSTIVVASNQVLFGLIGNGLAATARLANTPVVTGVYTVKATVTVPTGSESATWRLIARWASETTCGVYVSLSKDTITLAKPGTVYATLTPGGIDAFAGTKVLELRVDGNSMSVYLDSVLKLGPTTVADFSTTQGFGISCARSGAGGEAVNSVVDGFTILSGAARVERVLAVSNGDIYLGNSPESLDLLAAGALSASTMPTSADTEGKVVFADGANAPKVVDLTTDTLSTLTATAGVLPDPCKIAAVYRTRLVLANTAAAPQNIHMSRAGTITDFDYSQTDALAAVALNASTTAGRIGQPVKALIPFRDDSLVIGCDSSIFILKGDPADGGSVLAVSETVGIYGASAYTFDPEGNLYFVGSGGLYRMAPTQGSAPENISRNRVDSFFSSLNRESVVNVVWDVERHGCFIFLGYGTVASSHLWYDARTDGFFELTMPANHGPAHAIFYRGNDGTDRRVLLGGTDGFIREFINSALDDAGTAIDSLVFMGPYRPAGVEGEAVMTEMAVYLGESTGTVNASLIALAGDDPFIVQSSPSNFVNVTLSSQGKQTPFRQRVRGSVFWFKLLNTTVNRTWVLEQIIATFRQGGKTR